MSEEVTREVQTWDPIEWLDRIINGEQTIRYKKYRKTADIISWFQTT